MTVEAVRVLLVAVRWSPDELEIAVTSSDEMEHEGGTDFFDTRTGAFIRRVEAGPPRYSSDGRFAAFPVRGGVFLLRRTDGASIRLAALRGRRARGVALAPDGTFEGDPEAVDALRVRVGATWRSTRIVSGHDLAGAHLREGLLRAFFAPRHRPRRRTAPRSWE